MSNEFSLFRLVIEAHFIVQLVVLALVIASVASWTIILRKHRSIRNARETADGFETSFWSGGDLSTIFRRISGAQHDATGMESIFVAGFGEFGRLREQEGLTPNQVIEACRRTMKVSQMREMDNLEQSLATLATVGSTSPYVGLFGTVWGIMLAIFELGNTSTISTLAPQIVEALIPTAAGLFAAIPATIAYNRFIDSVDRLESRFDTFTEELSTILHRHARKIPAQ